MYRNPGRQNRYISNKMYMFSEDMAYIVEDQRHWQIEGFYVPWVNPDTHITLFSKRPIFQKTGLDIAKVFMWSSLQDIFYEIQ